MEDWYVYKFCGNQSTAEKKMKTPLLIFVATLLVTGASEAEHSVAVKAEVQSHSSFTLHCPSANFSHFLDVFTESAEIQKAFTKFPLKMQQLDLDAQPEPKPVLRLFNRNQIEFPLIPDATARTTKLLSLRVDQLSKRRAKVTLVKSDTDYQVSYFFSRNSCWSLVRIEDWSL